ncbi:MAG: adenylate/guanylate cyclase domain-containing protein [Chitinophagaceae bacterium]|nr:adenylate/guanylate cyclase domain-containing protein [Oligoflexus sp.]
MRRHWMMNKVWPFLTDDHRLSSKFHKDTAPFWALLHCAFYWWCVGVLGLKEDLIIRSVAALLILGNTFFLSPDKKSSFLQSLYVEIALAFNLPFLFSYNLVINQFDAYWLASIVFASVLYAYGAYPLIAIVGFPLITFSTLFASGYNFIWDQALRQVLGVIGFSWVLIVCILVIRGKTKLLFMENKELELKRELAQKALEEMEREELNAKKNSDILRTHYEILETYASPSVRKEIASGKDPRNHPRTEVKRAVLFTDLIGFTRLTSGLSLAETADFVDGFFEGVIEGVFHNFLGEVDKLMGDAVMSLFDTPDKAMIACLEIRKRVELKNEHRVAAGKAPYQFGIGLSYGSMIYGNFGNSRKIDRSVVGDYVNDSQRIEKLTRKYQVDTLATAEFIAELKSPSAFCRVLDYTTVGASKPMKIYEIFGHQSDEVKYFKMMSRDYLEKAVTCKASGDSEGYSKEIEQWVKDYRDSPLCALDPFFMDLVTKNNLIHKAA